MAPMFEPESAKLETTMWFEEEVVVGKQYDFFYKRPPAYGKKTRAI